ncbi:hypothetical protein V6N12_019784 [Hibiscus sabdariffa]|uniref:Uncharacterized protein n=1 Tax=Hibiscus sabdariffa TaxID=183260 RepID=A0ABR2AZQ4_9ROSI
MDLWWDRKFYYSAAHRCMLSVPTGRVAEVASFAIRIPSLDKIGVLEFRDGGIIREMVVFSVERDVMYVEYKEVNQLVD